MKKEISITNHGYGLWYIYMSYRGKRLGCFTTNVRAIDDYKSDESDKDERDGRTLLKSRGYKALYKEIANSFHYNKQKQKP